MLMEQFEYHQLGSGVRENSKKDLLICLFCLPGLTLKHCFLAGLTLSIDHIFLLWEACLTISFYLYSSERWSTLILIDVAVVLLSYSPNSLFMKGFYFYHSIRPARKP